MPLTSLLCAIHRFHNVHGSPEWSHRESIVPTPVGLWNPVCSSIHVFRWYLARSRFWGKSTAIKGKANFLWFSHGKPWRTTRRSHQSSQFHRKSTKLASGPCILGPVQRTLSSPLIIVYKNMEFNPKTPCALLLCPLVNSSSSYQSARFHRLGKP